MRKLLAGVSSLLVIVGILVGIPAVLIWAAGNPLPTTDQLTTIVTFRPDYGNTILLTKILPLLAWGAWALFAFPLLGEIGAAIRHRPTRKTVAAFRGQQKMSAKLVTAVIVMFAGIGAGAPAMAAEAPAVDTHSATATTTSVTSASTAETSPPTVDAPDYAQGGAGAATEQTHVVAAGETLWGIAEDRLGDGARYGEIFDANQGVQNNGAAFTNPDVIHPGWELTVPGTTASADEGEPAVASPAEAPEVPQVPDEAPEEEANTGGGAEPEGGGTDAGVGSGEQVAPAEPAEVVEEAPAAVEPPATSSDAAGDAEESESSWVMPLMTAGGVGAVLAAVLLGTLAGRRLLQRRRRKIGERTAEPAGEAAVYEQELAVVENGFAVSDLDSTLRWLQEWSEKEQTALPSLLAVRLAEKQIALYLDEPADLPEPFTAATDDKTLWILPEGVRGEPTRPTAAPYPALTSIGLDATGAMLLLDFERVGALNLIGDETVALEMMTAMSLELAGTPWADQLQVTLVGMPTGLAAELGEFTVNHVDDTASLIRGLRHDLDTRRGAVDSYSAIDAYEARATETDSDTWAPHLVFLAEMPDEADRAELVELIAQMPRLGVAAIARGDVLQDAATIEITSPTEARYHSGGTLPPLPFAPQKLDDREEQHLRELLAVAEQPATSADLDAELPTRPNYSDVGADEGDVDVEASDGQPVDIVDETVEVEGDSEPVDARDPEGDREEEAADAPAGAPDVSAEETADHDAGDEPAVGLAAESTASAPEESDDVEVEEVPDWVPPRLLILGPIGAEGLPEKIPGRAVELMTFLALQDGPVATDVITEKLYPNKFDPSNNDVKVLAKKVRAAVGRDPFGRPLLPNGKRGVGFTAHPDVVTDWHEFRELIGSDLKTTSNANLAAAIRLVRGTPFDGAAARRGWWGWRGTYDSHIREAVIDAAAELVDRCLRSGDLSQSRMAARVAQAIDPLNEAGLCLELRTALKAGDEAECDRIIDELYEKIAGTNNDLNPESVDAIDAAQRQFPQLTR